MHPFFLTFNIILPVFVVIALGALVRRTGLVDQSFVMQTNRLLYYILLPLLLFYKIGTADFASSFNLKLTLAMLATLSLGALLSYILACLLGYPSQDRGTFSQGAFRGNLAYVGLPIVLSAYGDTGFTKAGMLMGCLIPAINLLSIMVLVISQRQHQSTNLWKLVRNQLLYNPLILGATAGIAWGMVKLPMPGFAERSLSMVTTATLPLALLAIGGAFSMQQLHGDLKRAGYASVFKLAAFPMLNYVIICMLHIKGMDLAIAVLLSGAPTAAASYVMAQELNGNPRLTSSIIILSTMFSVVSYTIILMLLGIIGLL